MPNSVHRLIPKLRVSPLALSPRLPRFDLVLSVEDREGIVTKKRLPSYCLYDTREEKEAGTTLAASPRGPRNGVHLRAAASRVTWRVSCRTLG